MALHTDIPTRAELHRLLTATSPLCVSIYLPTHRVTQETQQDRLVLRGLTDEAVEQLRAAGADEEDIDGIEQQLRHLADEDDDFWADQADSLAVFATPDRFATHRLPNHLTPMVEVSDRFHVKPLLRAVTFPQAAWVLALAQGGSRLLEIGPSGPPEEVPVEGMPKDAWSAGGNKVHRAREGAYARKVDAALRGVLKGSELPLILAAAQPMAGLFRSANTYPHLVDEREHGNPEGTSDAELADAARAILDDVYADQLQELATLFDERRSQGRTATEVTDIARLATLGAVDTVIVDIDEAIPGLIDEAGEVTFDEVDDAINYGVVDEIVRRVLLAGGRVLAVRADDIPEGGPASAILRYAL
ncbi:MAG: hypothetical protein JHC95_03040 [Solirubrobacteraceae bacterium]|nr:hypothetical protein [Solirubrobacteraceae bacterium]